MSLIWYGKSTFFKQYWKICPFQRDADMFCVTPPYGTTMSHPTAMSSFCTALHFTTSTNVAMFSGQSSPNSTIRLPFAGMHWYFFPPALYPPLSHADSVTSVAHALLPSETVTFLLPACSGITLHVSAGKGKPHEGQHSHGFVTTGYPRQSSGDGRRQDMAAQMVRSSRHWQKVQGSGCHVTLPPGLRLTQPFRGQRLPRHEGQHSPGGVVGLAHRGAGQATLLQLVGAASPLPHVVTRMTTPTNKHVAVTLLC